MAQHEVGLKSGTCSRSAAGPDRGSVHKRQQLLWLQLVSPPRPSVEVLEDLELAIGAGIAGQLGAVLGRSRPVDEVPGDRERVLDNQDVVQPAVGYVDHLAWPDHAAVVGSIVGSPILESRMSRNPPNDDESD